MTTLTNDTDLYAGSWGSDTAVGYDGDDAMYGSWGNDLLIGGKGDDIILGGFGDDVLRGGSGDDVLTAGFGNDSLSGGTGDDILIAGSGTNVLRGGDGADTFVIVGPSGTTTINDFDISEGDTIDIIDWGVSSFSDLAMSYDAAGSVVIEYQDYSFKVKGLTETEIADAGMENLFSIA
ncbi:calcium-binding protein [Vibrio maerlii]|uniref:calcium-binding protein n=1 Tax=Vibrio maerlii TaxID=2231648 RepID=UPI0013DF5196|nr:calcium-binding protein [Vibrio maerlii]